MKRLKKCLVMSVCLGCMLSKTSSAGTPDHFLLGAYPGKGVTAEAFETEIGHSISLVDHILKFGDMPASEISDDISAGRIPMLTWTSDGGSGGQAHAEDIISGQYDKQIVLQAQAIGLLGGTVLVRWQPDMTDMHRYAEFYQDISPNQRGTAYISVWKHIHQIFLHRGATNVQWVWSPEGSSYKIIKGVFECGLYFPGSRFVDWMGVDSLNKYDAPLAYDADESFLSFYALAPMLAPGKPLIHTQTAATNATDAQREWIATAQSDLQLEFPLVRGFVWFNQNEDAKKKGSAQYSLDGAGLQAFEEMASDPYFQ